MKGILVRTFLCVSALLACACKAPSKVEVTRDTPPAPSESAPALATPEPTTALPAHYHPWDGAVCSTEYDRLDGGAPVRHNHPPSRRKATHWMPWGWVGVQTRNAPTVVDRQATVSEAEELQQRAEQRSEAGTWQLWHFQGFDDKQLYFFFARYEKNTKPGRPWGTYVISHRYRVARSADAEKRLYVDKTIAQYEVGVNGVRAGMSEGEILRILGKPLGVQLHQLAFVFDYHYADMDLRFFNCTVGSIRPRGPASKKE